MPGEGLVRAEEGRAREVGFGSNRQPRKAECRTRSQDHHRGDQGESPLNTRMGSGNLALDRQKVASGGASYSTLSPGRRGAGLRPAVPH